MGADMQESGMLFYTESDEDDGDGPPLDVEELQLGNVAAADDELEQSQAAAATEPQEKQHQHAPEGLQFLPRLQEQPRVHQQRKALILFDLNGVLIKENPKGPVPGGPKTGKRRTAFHVRPGMMQLLRLLPRYQLGIFSSAMQKTVARGLDVVMNDLRKHCENQQLGIELPKTYKHLFSVILDRDYCQLDATWSQREDGKAWDTVKPLASNDLSLASTLLIDNELRKAAVSEVDNMIVLPTWEHLPDLGRASWSQLVDGLLAIPEDAGDLRPYAQNLNTQLVNAETTTAAVGAAQHTKVQGISMCDGDADTSTVGTVGTGGAASLAKQPRKAVLKAKRKLSLESQWVELVGSGGEADGDTGMVTAAAAAVQQLRQQLLQLWDTLEHIDSSPAAAAASTSAGAGLPDTSKQLFSHIVYDNTNLYAFVAMAMLATEECCRGCLAVDRIYMLFNAALLKNDEQKLLGRRKHKKKQSLIMSQLCAACDAGLLEEVSCTPLSNRYRPVLPTSVTRMNTSAYVEPQTSQAAAADEAAQQLSPASIAVVLEAPVASTVMAAAPPAVAPASEVAAAAAPSPTAALDEPAAKSEDEEVCHAECNDMQGATAEADEVTPLVTTATHQSAGEAQSVPRLMRQVVADAIAAYAGALSPEDVVTLIMSRDRLLRRHAPHQRYLAKILERMRALGIVRKSSVCNGYFLAWLPRLHVATASVDALLAYKEVKSVAPPQPSVADDGVSDGVAVAPDDQPAAKRQRQRKPRPEKLPSSDPPLQPPHASSADAGAADAPALVCLEMAPSSSAVPTGPLPTAPKWLLTRTPVYERARKGPAASQGVVAAAPPTSCKAVTKAAAQGVVAAAPQTSCKDVTKAAAQGVVAAAPPTSCKAMIKAAAQLAAAPAGRTPLHHELISFMEAITPTETDLQRLTEAMRAVQLVAQSLWPNARAALFGSQASGLALPGSDLDVVILGVGDEFSKPEEGFIAPGKNRAMELLTMLAKQLRSAGMIKSHQVIRAKVPIVKTKLLLSACRMVSASVDNSSSIPSRIASSAALDGLTFAVDICMGNANGVDAAVLMQQVVLKVPPLRPLVVVLKAMLKEHALNEVFTGGLSSYALTNMLIAHLQCEGFDIASLLAEQKLPPRRLHAGKRWKLARAVAAEAAAAATARMQVDAAQVHDVTDGLAQVSPDGMTTSLAHEAAHGAVPLTLAATATDQATAVTAAVESVPSTSSAAAVASTSASMVHASSSMADVEAEVMRYLRGLGNQVYRCSADLGELFVAFCYRFGICFDYMRDAVSVRHGGVIAKPLQTLQSKKMFVEDPQQPGKNIADASHEVHKVQQLLRTSHATLQNPSLRQAMAADLAADSSPSWEDIQADGSHHAPANFDPYHSRQSDQHVQAHQQSPHLITPNQQQQLGGFPVLRSILEVDLALGKDVFAQRARQQSAKGLWQPSSTAHKVKKQLQHQGQEPLGEHAGDAESHSDDTDDHRGVHVHRKRKLKGGRPAAQFRKKKKAKSVAGAGNSAHHGEGGNGGGGGQKKRKQQGQVGGVQGGVKKRKASGHGSGASVRSGKRRSSEGCSRGGWVGA